MRPPSHRRLRTAWAPTLFALAACSSTTATATDVGTPGRLHGSYAAGWKFKESAWTPGDREALFGFADLDLRLGARPLWVVGKLLVGTADAPAHVADPEADSSGSSELCLGLRHYRSLGRAEPYVSAGLVWLTAEVVGYREASADAFRIDEDQALGGWVDLGLRLPVVESITVGLAVHHSLGPDVDLAGRAVAPGGTSLLFTVGYRR